MKFITNRISTSKSTDFSEFVQKLASGNPSLSKTASSEAVTKKANIANFGDKKANPFGKEDEAKDESKGEEKGEEKEGEEKESCASSETEVKTAKDDKKGKDGIMKVKMQKMDPVGGTNTGKTEGEKKKASHSDTSKPCKDCPVCDCKPCKCDTKGEKKQASNSYVDPANKGVTHKVDECCGAPTSKGDDGSEGDKKSAPKSEAKKEETKEASSKLVRIANLDTKTKNEWKAYWKNLYPTEYVEAMFADK